MVNGKPQGDALKFSSMYRTVIFN